MKLIGMKIWISKYLSYQNIFVQRHKAKIIWGQKGYI